MGYLVVQRGAVGYWRVNTPLFFWATVDLVADATPELLQTLREWGYRKVRFHGRDGLVLFARREVAPLLQRWVNLKRRTWFAVGWAVRIGLLTCPAGVMLTKARPNVWPWRRRRGA